MTKALSGTPNSFHIWPSGNLLKQVCGNKSNHMVGKASSSFTSPSLWSPKSPDGDPYLTCPDGICLLMDMHPPQRQLRVLVGLPTIKSQPLPQDSGRTKHSSSAIWSQWLAQAKPWDTS